MLHVKDEHILVENIITGIEKICKARHIDCCRKTVSLIVRNNLMRPDLVLTYSQESRKSELVKLCEECISQLSVAEPLHQRLLKLQGCFHRLSGKEDRMFSEYDQLLVRTLEPMKRAIIVFEPRGAEDVEKAFDLIAKYSMLLTLVGDAGDPVSFNSVRAILRSFYGKSDLKKFRLKPLNDRVRTLNDLAYTTAGMVIYKTVCSGVSNNFTQYSDRMEAALLDIEETLSNVSEFCIQSNTKLVNLFTKYIKFTIEDGEINISREFPDLWEHDEKIQMHYMLLIEHQAMTYIDIISKAIHKLKIKFKLWSVSYRETMKSIIKIANRVDVVTFSEAYPIFIQLSLTNKNFFWGTSVIENFKIALQSIKKYFIFDKLPSIIKEMRVNANDRTNENPCKNVLQRKFEPIFSQVKDQYLLTILRHIKSTGLYLTADNENFEGQNGVIKSYNEFVRKDFSNELSVEVNNEVVETDHHSEETGQESNRSVGEEYCGTDCINEVDSIQPMLDSKLLMFNGFDPVALVEGDGILLQANPTIAFFSYLGCSVGFYCIETALRFSNDSSDYFSKIVDFIRINPIYIEILQVYNLLEPLIGYGWLYSSKETEPSDQGTQTPDHFLGTYGEQYTLHSRWAINAAVLKMADIQNKRTKSCMVELVQYRTYDQACQTVDLVDSETQARRETGTCTAKPMVWRHGLRGGPASTVSLTLPVEEPHLTTITPSRRSLTPEIESESGDYLELIGTKKTLLYSLISLCSTFLDNYESQVEQAYMDK